MASAVAHNGGKYNNNEAVNNIVPSKRKAEGNVGAFSEVVVDGRKRQQLAETLINKGVDNNDNSIDWEAEEEKKLQLPSEEELKLAVTDYLETHRTLPVIDPTKDQDSPYPEVPGLPNSYHTFNLHHGGLSSLKRLRAINSAKNYHAQQKSFLMGYQCNQFLEYEKTFSNYMDYSLNNIGDAFVEGNFTLNTKFMERAVLDYYAELWHAKYPHDSDDPESYWGFCLTMGCTEGNLYGMWNARDYLGGKKMLIDTTTKTVKRKQGARTITTQIKVPRIIYHQTKAPEDKPNAYTPIAFFSEDTHYSVTKCMTILDIRTFYAEGTDKYPGQCPITEDGVWPTEVPSNDSGAIDIEALCKLVAFFATEGYPIMVCFNYGTTFKGAYDDVATACKKLRPILLQNGLLERKVYYNEDDTSVFDIRTGYWFHVDGALGAAYMPYIEMAHKAGLVVERGPNFDFRLPMVHSIAMSGHKWIGATVPCGLYMTRNKYQMMPPSNPEYIGTPDTTFAGSRSGLSPMLLWDNVARHSYQQMIKKTLRLEALTVYAYSALLQLQEDLQTDLYVARTPLALTVRFKRANDDICQKYSLSNEDLDGLRYSHIFIMEHVTTTRIDDLISDLSQENAFYEEDDTVTAYAAAVLTVTPSAIAPATNRIALVPTRGRGFHS